MNAGAALRRRWQELLALAERHLPALTRLRRAEPLPIRLDRRRIYVLPTLFGLVFGTMLVVMALGALNYNNNPALLLTCLMTATAFLSVLIGFRNLDGLSLRAVQAEPCYAGDLLDVALVFDPGSRRRETLCIAMDSAASVIRGDADSLPRAQLQLQTQRRGYFTLPRIKVFTTWPYGLFRCWSWLNPQQQVLVFPRPEAAASALPPQPQAADAGNARMRGDEFGALREYRVSDPLRLIAWKASARHDRLLVRDPEQPQNPERVLDFDSLPQLDLEARIARLARWVLLAEEQRVRYTLRLPQQQLGPDLGSAHAYRCLRELALL